MRIFSNTLKHHGFLEATGQFFFDPTISILTLYFCAQYYSLTLFSTDLLVFFLVFLLVLAVFGRFDLYRSWRGAPLFNEAKRVIVAWLLVLSLVLFLGYMTGIAKYLARDVFVTWALITPLVLILGRLSIRIPLRHFRRKGKNLRHVVIVGAGRLGLKLLHHIRKAPESGMNVVGFFDDRWSKGLQELDGKPVLGSLDDILEFVRKEKPDRIYIALPLRAEQRVQELLAQLQDVSSSIYFVPDIFVFELLHTRVEDLNGIPLFALFGTPFSGIDDSLKRCLDLVLSSFILILIAPLLLVVTVLVKKTSTGPVLYKQTRYGLHGEEIKVFKFRTMVTCEDDASFIQAKKSDPRVTRVGSFLRKTSIDELPQFLNVLRGEMSIVGPRPHPVKLNEQYRHLVRGYMLRHKVKPGITGWAQINGWRGETETLEKMKKRVEYDLEYIRNWSLGLDLKIILLTIFKGFKGQNAY
ncbi:MAG: undecaprenyl-phosphate glucose phosphotransferase [Deltaproteobacteria bacterium]|nr:undecaprenyl-phosphate glucose phosphotransferase [Deltaproteobacteria bacterium]